VTLLNTAAMWGFNGTAGDGPVPYLAAAVVDRGAAVAPPPGARRMPQPDGVPPIEAAGLPAGTWSGRVRQGGALAPAAQRQGDRA
jgi:hypothetical protein